MRDGDGSLGLVEIACDESGSEGEKLIGGETDVFAHASVRLSAESAAQSILEIRRRIGSPAQEYKANHLLRTKNRAVLIWLLEPSGPIHGNAHVHLTEKAFVIVSKIITLLATDDHYAMAVTLYRDGQRAFGRDRWEAFLSSFNNLMRPRNRRGEGTSIDSFFHLVDLLRQPGVPGQVHRIMDLLRHARPQVEAFRAQLLRNPAMIPALDPLIPAIAQTVAHWGGEDKPVSIIHDRHIMLTDKRVMRLKEILTQGRLTSLRLVDSRSDPRVQVADFLAGVARKIASDELNGRGDAELTVLLRPYVNPSSVWGDDRSWSLLVPR